MQNFPREVEKLVKTFYPHVNCPIAVFAKDGFVITAGLDEYDGCFQPSPQLEKIITERNGFTSFDSELKYIYPVIGLDKQAMICGTIVSRDELLGTLVFFGNYPTGTHSALFLVLQDAIANILND